MTTPRKTVAKKAAPKADLEARKRGRDETTGQILEPSTVMPTMPDLVIKPVTPARGLTPADETRLLRIARSRAKVGKSHIEAAQADLLAEVEKKLSEEFCYEDEMWAEARKIAEAAIKVANEQIAKISDERGVPKKFRPGIGMAWASRGENADRGRRSELRMLAKARVKAIGTQTKAKIDVRLAEIEADIYVGGLSDQGKEYLITLENPRTLMPEITIAELDDAYYEANPYRTRPGTEEDDDDEDEDE
jgi:hypothetical protein